MIEKSEKGLLYFRFKEFNDLGFIKHIFTSRVGWINKQNKEQLSNILNVDMERIIDVKQVHRADILVIDSLHKLSFETSKMEYGGLITNLPNVLLTTYHADCVPIYFVDRKKRIIGLAHGGWRGTFENISGKMIDKMIKVYNSNVGDILVAIGPSIGPCCYEVGKDVSELFIDRYKSFNGIIINRDGKTYLDLWKVNFLQLTERQIPKENIVLSKICTSCNVDKFYSYRKENGTDKRMIAGICMI